MITQGTYPRRPNLGTPKFEADPLNSTYRWEFFLTVGHPMNKVPKMDGYSKGMGFENTNKVDLLYKKLINPVLTYLPRCDSIIVYQNNRHLPKDLHPILIELYPHDFAAHGWIKETEVFTGFLSAYYEEFLRKGVMPPVEDRRKNVRKAVYLVDLDHSKYTFKNLDELKAFCKSRVEKYSAQCMLGWYYRHADFQPELFENDITGALAHAAHTAPTMEAAQAARQEINNLHDRFKSNR